MSGSSASPGASLAARRTSAATVAARIRSALVAVAVAVSTLAPLPVRADAVILAPLTPAQVSHRLSGEVFGYLPYWSVKSWTDPYLRYDLLSTIAFFGVGVRDDGSIRTDTPGYQAYMSDTATTIIQNAHAAGVRVVITFESFGFSHNAAFFSDPVAQQTFVQQATALMAARGADGANLDVEEIDSAYFPGYGAVIKALGDASRATNPIAQISVATNGNTSGAQMAAVAAANGADLAFLMGYAYRSSGSSPVGAIDPLVRADGGLSLSRSLDVYARYGVPMNRIVLGLPYYGMTWPTITGDLHADRQPGSAGFGSGRAFFPYTLPDAATGSTLDHDPVEQSARLAWNDTASGTWWQTYYNDPQSLAPKERLTIDRGLAGMGIWALGYDRGQAGYWETIEATFRSPKVTSLTVMPNPTNTLAVSVAIGWQDGAHPTQSVRLSNDGSTWSDWQPVAPTIPWTLGSPDGKDTVWVELQDTAGAISPRATTWTVLDTHAPTITSLTAKYNWNARRWRVAWGATDALSGVRGYQVRFRVGTGQWQDARLFTNTTAIFLTSSPRYRLTVAVRAQDQAGNWMFWKTAIGRTY